MASSDHPPSKRPRLTVEEDAEDNTSQEQYGCSQSAKQRAQLRQERLTMLKENIDREREECDEESKEEAKDELELTPALIISVMNDCTAPGKNLSHRPDARNNFALVMALVAHDPENLQFASERLQADERILHVAERARLKAEKELVQGRVRGRARGVKAQLGE